MGANHSRTRKLTVENEDPTSVIKVSDDVVQRLKNSQDSNNPPAAPHSPPQQQQQQQQQAAVYPQPPTLVVPPAYIYEPALSTVQLKQNTLQELKKNDEYWQSRLKSQQAKHNQINKIMDEEYNKAIEELEGKKSSEKKTQKLPPCQDCKEAVIECYKENPKEPMRCAGVVQAFQACVDEKRACIIASRD